MVTNDLYFFLSVALALALRSLIHFIYVKMYPVVNWRCVQITRCNIAFNVNSNSVQFNSVTKSCVTLCSPNGLQHIKLPCPSPTTQLAQSIELVMPSNHLILCRPFSSHLQSFPASGSFPVSQFFPSGGQSIGVSALASVLPMNIQDWFPLGLTGFDLPGVQRTLKSLFQHHSSKA